jgi:hypothetical protein
VWQVALLEAADRELNELQIQERTAIVNAIQKLAVHGPTLSYPHSSDVRGVAGLRELRPRAGRSAWRALYRRVGNVFTIAAIGPEAQTNRRGFERAVAAALARLQESEGGTM